MEKGDILNHYVVSKQENKNPKMKVLIQSIYTYVQNHEIYFKYEPTFYSGVLLFGVVGLKIDHTRIKRDLGKLITALDCQMQIINGTMDEDIGSARKYFKKSWRK